MHVADLARKAGFQADMNNNTRVWACLKDHNLLSDKQFPVAAHTYFGVKQTCMEGWTGLPIRLKIGGGREDKMTKYDPYGENMAKAALHTRQRLDVPP